MTPEELYQTPVVSLYDENRAKVLGKLEKYARGCQDEGKKEVAYTASFYNEAAAGAPGFLDHSDRKPRTRYDVGRVVVRRLTAMSLASERFPEVRIEGDSNAEDFVRACMKESRLPVRIVEARQRGGQMGTACLSWGLKNGRPRVAVHDPKYCRVMSWVDRDDLIPEVVFKAYKYEQDVWDSAEKETQRKTFWCICIWTPAQELRWEALPQEIATQEGWGTKQAPQVFNHNFGFTPFYWVQNTPCAETVDGESDIDGLCENLDTINQLESATTQGTLCNVDPTLVIKEPSESNDGDPVGTGKYNAIFSQGGAEYLELKGSGIQAAERHVDRVAQHSFDMAGVIDPDPDKLSGAAQSARALEILYQPMIATCDTLREQYAEHAIRPILRDMLRVARMYRDQGILQEDGRRAEGRFALPPRREGEESFERDPGDSDEVALAWQPYFQPTWQDLNTAAQAVSTANGGAPSMSARTGVQVMASMTGVEDVDAEIERIEEEQDERTTKAANAFGPPPRPAPAENDPFPLEDPPEDEPEDPED